MTACPHCGAESAERLCPSCGFVAVDPNPGRVLADRWRVGPLIGTGAMGRVYRGEHALLGRPIAVKLLAPELASNPEILARFRREALAASRLSHPNVVLTIDFGVDDATPYLIMELVEGRGLDAIIQDRGPLPPTSALRLFAQVADALGAAHSVGVVHRDVKPGNVLVVEERGKTHAKVADFGIAIMAGAETKRLTAVGLTVGTPDFMAPEQVMGKRVDARADVYGLGASLYEALTGRTPFRIDSIQDLLQAQLGDPPPVPSSIVGTLPPGVDQLMMDLMAKDPDARPRDGGAVIARITELLDRASAPVIESGYEGRVILVLGVEGTSEEAGAQRAAFRAEVESNGGLVAHTVGRETVALLSGAEAAYWALEGVRRNACGAGVRLAVHSGPAKLEDEVAFGDGVRIAIGLARLARAGEASVSEPVHDELGLGFRAGLESQGSVRVGGSASKVEITVFRVRGSDEDADPTTSVRGEADAQGIRWTCVCGARGRLARNATSRLRLRCGNCSRVLDVALSGSPLESTSKRDTDYVASHALRPADSAKGSDAVDDLLLDQLFRK